MARRQQPSRREEKPIDPAIFALAEALAIADAREHYAREQQDRDHAADH